MKFSMCRPRKVDDYTNPVFRFCSTDVKQGQGIWENSQRWLKQWDLWSDRIGNRTRNGAMGKRQGMLCILFFV